MAVKCSCCGAKIGLFGENGLVEEFDNPVCEKCFAKFKDKINDFLSSKNIRELDSRREALMKALDECGFIEEGKQYIVSVVDAKRDEISKHWMNAENQQQLKHLIDSQILTTGYNFEKYKITSYLGVISGSTVLGTGFLSEFNATLSDIFGAQSDLFSEKLEKAKETSLSKLKEKSVRMGGNAIIGIDFDYIMFENNMIGVVANGTSVIIDEDEKL